MADYHIPLLPGQTYHIFSRAIGAEKVFLEYDNYRFFLDKYKQHITPVAETFAYNLLPNHFHLLIRIKNIDDIESHFSLKKGNQDFTLEKIPEFIMERFGNFLNSYTKSFNKINNRKGGLFMDTLRRVEIRNDSDLANEIFYVHKNAVHHQYVSKIEDWKWSSYNSILSDSPTLLQRDEILEWFGGKEQFIQFHKQTIYPKGNMNLEDI
jgi:REP element-mobilizing transposase RayT